MKKRNSSFRLLPYKNEKMNVEEITNLQRAFKSSHCKKIKKITLDFRQPWTKKQMESTCEVLKNLVILRSLKFSFSDYPYPCISKRFLSNLGRSFKRLKLLKEIDLNFGSYEDETDIGLKMFCQRLKSLTLLKKIRLVFPISFSLVKNDIFHLSKSIKRLISLQSVHLCFFYCSLRVTDEGLQALTASLKRIVGLKSLRLSFSNCHNITDKGVLSLCEAIEKLTCLEEVDLCFDRYAQKITSAGEQRVRRTFRKHPSFGKYGTRFCLSIDSESGCCSKIFGLNYKI